MKTTVVISDSLFARAKRLSERTGRPLSRVRGPVVHDARVAALCVVHGVDYLVSRDRDFSLFPELVVKNPFAPPV